MLCSLIKLCLLSKGMYTVFGKTQLSFLISEFKAPEGKTINQNPYSTANQGGYKMEWLGAAGSENNFRLVFVPNDDGDAAVAQFGVQARSPRGRFSGRGWSNGRFTGTYR